MPDSSRYDKVGKGSPWVEAAVSHLIGLNGTSDSTFALLAEYPDARPAWLRWLLDEAERVVPTDSKEAS